MVDLKTHQDSVHGVVKYSCNECDYQATQKGSLKIHQDSVHKEIKFKCNECDNQFSSERQSQNPSRLSS